MLISNAKGVMIVGEAKGKPVMEAKEIIKAMMKSNGQAVTYHEPQERVVARAGNEECVCALTEQWFLKYGEASWRKGVEAHIKDTLDCYNPKAQTMFEDTIAWLRQWACSRTAGLGTRLPWDKEYRSSHVRLQSTWRITQSRTLCKAAASTVETSRAAAAEGFDLKT